MFKARTIFFLFFLVMGLFVAQWQGFSHGIAHGLEEKPVSSDLIKNAHQFITAEHQNFCDDHQVKHDHLSHDSEGNHHCAAYDAQTLGVAMPILPMTLPVIDKVNAAINSYLTYQASIEAYRPFDVRGPPNS